MAEGSVEEEVEYQDLSEVDEVWLGDESIAGKDFVAALNAVEEMQETLRELKDEFVDLEVGLDREDAVHLIWGRNSSLNKGQVRAGFRVMDTIIHSDPEDIAPRLMADQSSDLTIAEAAEVWEEVVTLAEKYGSQNTDDADDGDQP